MLEFNFDQEKRDTDELYKQLTQIADDIVAKASKTLDEIVRKIKGDLTNLSNREISDLMLQLGIEAYFFGQKKDHSILKQACAEALYKEEYAKAYSIGSGTAQARQNQALIDSSNQQAVKLLYDAVSNLMKTKLDEAHRLINVLNSVLINRNAEAKLNVVSSKEDKDDF